MRMRPISLSGTLAPTSIPCDNSTIEELVEPAIEEALVVGATNASGSELHVLVDF